MKRSLPVFLLSSVLLPFSLSAQSIWAGGSFVYAKPLGEFGQNVRQGFGLSGTAIVPKTGSPFAIRVDFNYLNYGNESQNTLVAGLLGRRSGATSNNILVFGIGPQLMVPRGRVRPYINVQGGFSYYYTEALQGASWDSYFESRYTEASTLKLSYGAGLGTMISLSSKKISPMLNVGAQYYSSGRTSYLTSHSVQSNETSVNIRPSSQTTDVRYMTYRIGLLIPF